MKKNALLLLMLCFLMTNAMAQNEVSSPASNEGSLLEKSQWSLNIIPLNIAYEHRIGDKSTIYAQAGLNLNRYDDANDSTTGFFSRRIYGLAIDFTAQYRYYYNLEKRKAKSRSFASNSGNFVGAKVTPLLAPIRVFSDKEVIKETGVVLAAMWGMQRVKKDLLVFNFNFGPAVRITSEGTDVDLIQGQLSLGFILGD